MLLPDAIVTFLDGRHGEELNHTMHLPHCRQAPISIDAAFNVTEDNVFMMHKMIPISLNKVSPRLCVHLHSLHAT